MRCSMHNVLTIIIGIKIIRLYIHEKRLLAIITASRWSGCIRVKREEKVNKLFRLVTSPSCTAVVARPAPPTHLARGNQRRGWNEGAGLITVPLDPAFRDHLILTLVLPPGFERRSQTLARPPRHSRGQCLVREWGREGGREGGRERGREGGTEGGRRRESKRYKIEREGRREGGGGRVSGIR